MTIEYKISFGRVGGLLSDKHQVLKYVDYKMVGVVRNYNSEADAIHCCYYLMMTHADEDVMEVWDNDNTKTESIV